ncbi:HD domain-containing phosphohydrolase [Desulfovibrio ferrophilus]|uniref:Metal dependent phosphohydrolase domain-containing protein n=1 Tax=Desulfovibrio ferrophilus TaxID=241368 RepID=A0A2Z6AVP2_9BACT|nr:HD domain-containing phosphohydrolase [Desulfovibrio ferrophilus]BBD07307.1 metal dependent phosphohydrolase domain-containing protein [Desulfovibrio ferrophilus]
MSCLRILVVEDESIVAMDIRHRLSKLGYEIVGEVETGEDAVRLAAELLPDLVLMDIMLAGEMDGVQAAAEIHSRVDLPIVYLSAYADDETLQRVKITQPFGYIIKPFEDRELHAAIEMACYRHRMERLRREDRMWMQTTLDSVGEAIISTDPSGMVTYTNAVAAAMASTSQQELKGKPLESILTFNDVLGELVDPVALALSGNSSERSDSLSLHLGNDRTVPVEVSCRTVKNDDDGVMGAVLAFRDISGRKETVRELRHTVAKLRQTVEATVQALVVTSEKRDPYTAGHQQRVAQLAVAIARRLGLEGDQLDAIRVTGLLHDLGKIYIPAEILSKPARLTEMEMGLMRTHSQVGYDILSGVPFPWAVADIVLQHHERLDGTGYPQGLSGDEILHESRIICVADVVEAMSSHRPYRAALGLDRALQEIRAGRGSRYDPEVVDACLSLFVEGDFVFE